MLDAKKQKKNLKRLVCSLLVFFAYCFIPYCVYAETTDNGEVDFFELDSNATKRVNKQRDYIFSYRLSVKDGVILNETYHFVRAMTPQQKSKIFKNTPAQKCEITHNAKTEKEFFNDNQEQILECLFIWGVKLEDITQATNAKATSTTILSIPPTRLRIQFGNEWANITRIRR